MVKGRKSFFEILMISLADMRGRGNGISWFAGFPLPILGKISSIAFS